MEEEVQFWLRLIAALKSSGSPPTKRLLSQTSNSLSKKGITRLGQTLFYSQEELLAMRGIGQSSLQLIQLLIGQYGRVLLTNQEMMLALTGDPAIQDRFIPYHLFNSYVQEWLTGSEIVVVRDLQTNKIDDPELIGTCYRALIASQDELYKLLQVR